jgi:TPR repeat protein
LLDGGTAAETRLAYSYYRQSMDAGSVTGQLRVGEMLARGEGTEQDVEAGMALISDLAANENGAAYLLLGDLFADATVGDPDPDAAIAAYERAAELGEPAALLRLGDIYRDGVLLPADGERAAEYYRRAADGDPATTDAAAPAE